MNNLKRQERRKLNDRRDEQRREFTELPQINRAHRACEGECIELKEIVAYKNGFILGQEQRIKSLYLLLAKTGSFLSVIYDFTDGSTSTSELIAEIDAILPATEGDKNA